MRFSKLVLLLTCLQASCLSKYLKPCRTQVAENIKRSQGFGPVRDDDLLDLVECFAGPGPECNRHNAINMFLPGEHMIYSAVKNIGMKAHALDISFSSKMNILSSFGFLLTLYNVPRLDVSKNVANPV